MATKNNAAKAAPSKAKAKAEPVLTAGQKAAATRKAKADAADNPDKAVKAAPAKSVKVAPAKVTPVKVAKVVKEQPDVKTPPKVAKAVVAKVAEPAAPEVPNPVVGRKQLGDSVRTLMVAAGFGVSPQLATMLVEKFEVAVGMALAEGNDVALPGFGVFKVSNRAERDGRNPATGEPMKVAASVAVTFKVGKALKTAVNPAKAGDTAEAEASD